MNRVFLEEVSRREGKIVPRDLKQTDSLSYTGSMLGERRDHLILEI